MTNLEIAEKLREQIKVEWPYVSTILALYENNKDGIFADRIQSMVSKLLPDEVFYCKSYLLSDSIHNPEFMNTDTPILYGNRSFGEYKAKLNSEVYSLPINIVLFATKDNPLGILK
jgi:hypothetical protein